MNAATCLLILLLNAAPDGQDSVEYLSDLQHHLLFAQQAWGELGLDRCAFETGQPVLPLQIGDRKYEKGLGHHAKGELILDLAGEYARFESQVGLQPLPGGHGSAVFKVFVDDQLQFDSGVMKPADGPRAVSVPLAGAMELRLVVEDAGDGFAYDCANWAEARLVRAAGTKARPVPTLDVAPFGQVIASDPARLDGSRANRVQEFHAEDLFLDTPLRPDDKGRYILKGGASIGLKWPERRMLRELGLELQPPLPDAGDIQVQCWVGESLWQGRWQPLPGKLQKTALGYTFRVDWSLLRSLGGQPALPLEARSGTRKIRWILNGTQSIAVSRLTALTAARLETAEILLEAVEPTVGEAQIEVYNGTLAPGKGGQRQNVLAARWDLSKPLPLTVNYNRRRTWNPDRTVLRLRLPRSACAVAVDDVLAGGAVYIPEHGVYVRKTDAPVLAEYLKQIAAKKTILQQVHEAPDQTFEAALKTVHNPVQDRGPMMISLACDNHKLITHRHGMIQFADRPQGPNANDLRFPCAMELRFGSGAVKKFKRHLDGGWLPAPVTELQEAGINYRQRCMVIPADDTPGGDSLWHGKALGICELKAENKQSAPAEYAMRLTFIADVGQKPRQAAALRQTGEGIAVEGHGRVLAVIRSGDAQLKIGDNGVVNVTGTLEAGATAALRVYFPSWPFDPERFQEPSGDYLELLREYWERVFRTAAHVELPDRLLLNVIKASQVHCLIVARNEDNGARVAPWAAAVVYGPLESEGNSPLRGLDVWGHDEFARRALQFYVKRYDPAGYLTTGYTLMGTGWHLWTLGDHYKLCRDRAWFKTIAPEVARVCRWVMAQRAKTRKLDASGEKVPEYGLMPPGVMADWNAFAYHFCLNGYYYAGLKGAGEALADIGWEDAAAILSDAEAFREDILRAYRRTRQLTPVYPLRNGTSVAPYPAQVHTPGPTGDFFVGEDGNRSWCYDVELGAHQLVPHGVLPAESREVAWMMDHMEDVQFLSEGWFDFPAERSRKDPFNYGGFSKVQPYYCRNGEIYALRDDVKPFIRSYFNALSTLLSLENLSLQEHFAAVAAWNKTHETGYFLLHSRLMLVQERGDELWLAPFVTDRWLNDGAVIALQNVPTAFGPASYLIVSGIATGTIDARVDVPERQPPGSIVLRLRHPDGKAVRAAVVKGKYQAVQAGGDTIRITAPAGTLDIRAEF